MMGVSVDRGTVRSGRSRVEGDGVVDRDEDGATEAAEYPRLYPLPRSRDDSNFSLASKTYVMVTFGHMPAFCASARGSPCDP